MSKIRIIGGDWRGRRLEVAERTGLRPTPDRVRETLFNWLQGDLAGARCLDLFSGTGALGLEALSRGAAEVQFVDKDSANIRQLQQHLRTLDAEHRAQLVRADALRQLQTGGAGRFDIVFVDPPYRQGLQQSALAALLSCQALTPQAMIYVELAANEQELQLADTLYAHRSRRAGQVAYHLLEYRPATAQAPTP